MERGTLRQILFTLREAYCKNSGGIPPHTGSRREGLIQDRIEPEKSRELSMPKRASGFSKALRCGRIRKIPAQKVVGTSGSAGGRETVIPVLATILSEAQTPAQRKRLGMGIGTVECICQHRGMPLADSREFEEITIH